jgi:hypothetical protein
MTITTTERVPTAKQIKRYIGGNGSMLVLAEHEGALWASNRHWAVRAAHLEPFLGEHGIDGPGVYDIGGRIASRRTEPADPPRVFSDILDLASYTVPLKHVTIGDYDEVYTQDRQGLLLLLQRPGEAETGVVALPVDQLEWLEGAPVQTPVSQVCNVELFATERPRGPVAIVAEPFEDLGPPELAAVLMPSVRIEPVDTGPCLDCGKTISYAVEHYYPLAGGTVCVPCGEARSIPKEHQI